jgi:hypothetical protein
MKNIKFSITIKDFKKAKESRESVRAALLKVLNQGKKSYKRVDAFIEFIQEHYNNAGKNTYSNLKRLFIKVTSI